ncbi:pyrroloquinoline quinone precursor peptide PqqA [Streptomyces sp. AD681]|nr:pyrroloquinoline quinone precursor peptide PqqA [Streptomyces sp. AD681]MDA5147008.1 pyrroloquinoline quinone precursor peptide PqqA [Streptomyces sp. AD681]
MNKDIVNTEAQPQHQPERSRQVCTGWQAPDFTVVDTAMEVTAYSLRQK